MNRTDIRIKKIKLLIAAMLLLVVSCNAFSNQLDSKSAQCDTVIVRSDSIIAQNGSVDSLCVKKIICANNVKDSITEIILNFKKVECKLQGKNPKDTNRIEVKKKLPRKLNEVLRYILLDEDNYKSNDIVYGAFSSTIRYKIIQSRRIYVYAEFDFGLRKWRILNSKEEVLFQWDIKENNLQMLRFSRVVFPEDETLKILQNNLKSL
ncbi:MAG TPA: hypothetical protein IAA88_08715 [Candidatus Avimuribaculum pullicola]|nr:hypothetical protein [Candidatus Avimuribaculum pullicola]